MKLAIPWILVLLLGGGVYYFHSQVATRDEQIAQLNQQAGDAEQLKKENEDLSKLRGAADENARLHKDNEELPRLRGEVQQLRQQIADLNKKLGTAQAQGAALQQQQDRLSAENQGLRDQQLSSQQAAILEAQKAHVAACVTNLRLLDQAKAHWAQDNGKGADAMPTPNDLLPYFPQNKYPSCPDGGAYTLNAVQAPAQCSIPSHAQQ